MMEQISYKELTIRISNAAAAHTAKRNYSGGGEGEYAASVHSISVIKDEKEISSCTVSAGGGATGVSRSSFVVDNDQLVICCGDTVFCLSLPALDLRWKVHADTATCFRIFKLEDDYLVHGEMEISRLRKDGTIAWKFCGADIFVSLEGKDELKVYDNYIELTDFLGNTYKLGFDGEPVDDGVV